MIVMMMKRLKEACVPSDSLSRCHFLYQPHRVCCLISKHFNLYHFNWPLSTHYVHWMALLLYYHRWRTLTASFSVCVVCSCCWHCWRTSVQQGDPFRLCRRRLASGFLILASAHHLTVLLKTQSAKRCPYPTTIHLLLCTLSLFLLSVCVFVLAFCRSGTELCSRCRPIHNRMTLHMERQVWARLCLAFKV